MIYWVGAEDGAHSIEEEAGLDQKWFEMPEVRCRKLEGAVWVPLLSRDRRTKGGSYHALGCPSSRASGLSSRWATKLRRRSPDWRMGIGHNHTGVVENGR